MANERSRVESSRRMVGEAGRGGAEAVEAIAEGCCGLSAVVSGFTQRVELNV
jgi:hypothetical protein